MSDANADTEIPTPDEAAKLTLGEPLSTPDEEPEQELVAEHLEAYRRANQRFVTAANNPNPPTRDDMNRVGVITEQVMELASAIEFLCPESRDKSLALTHLEDVLTRASRSLYIKEPVGGVKPALVDLAQERILAERAEGAQ